MLNPKYIEIQMLVSHKLNSIAQKGGGESNRSTMKALGNCSLVTGMQIKFSNPQLDAFKLSELHSHCQDIGCGCGCRCAGSRVRER